MSQIFQCTYTGAIAVYTFLGGSGSIHLDDLNCTGHESRLIDCPHSGIGVHNCVHSEDAGVRCIRPCMLMRNAIRLAVVTVLKPTLYIDCCSVLT